jgi:heavy metal translocating P-type ATPase
VDCVVLEGLASFDESSLTGESLPVEHGQGEQLLSGSINLDGAVTVRALRSAADSQFEQIVKLVRNAASSQSPFVRLADRYSIPFTLLSFAIATAVWVLSGQAIRFLEVLVVATPCPLILGAPIALISGMSRSAKHGIIVKTGSALERLAEVRTMGFDKTGTLTRGKPVVDQVIAYGNTSKQEVLALAAALEQNSNHVLARTIINEAGRQKIKFPKVKNMKELPGFGLLGLVAGHEVVVGKWRYMREASLTLPKNFDKKILSETAAFVARNGKVVGAITFIDELRPESKHTIKRLRQLGVRRLLMVTGDNTATAQLVAKQLGIDDVRAETLPADKLKAIEMIKDRPVAFVGDGVNDAPVLTAADVGIALGARGSTVASESADVVIMLDDLERVASSVAIAKRTFAIARQSILIGIFISIGLMLIFATGKFKPVYGAAIQELVDITVIFNALRAHLDQT